MLSQVQDTIARQNAVLATLTRCFEDGVRLLVGLDLELPIDLYQKRDVFGEQYSERNLDKEPLLGTCDLYALAGVIVHEGLSLAENSCLLGVSLVWLRKHLHFNSVVFLVEVCLYVR